MLTTSQAAEFLKVTPATVREWARKGIIPARPLGRVWRFDEQELRDAGKSTPCPSTVTRIPATGGFDSRSVVEKFASQRARRIAKRPKSTSTSAVTSTGARLSLVKSDTSGRPQPIAGSKSEPGSAA